MMGFYRVLLIAQLLVAGLVAVDAHADHHKQQTRQQLLLQDENDHRHVSIRWNTRDPPPFDRDEVGTKLLPLAYQPLPLGSIKPRGWMRDQLKLMASGLPGHSHDFYRLITNATWLGGDEEYNHQLNEAFPYWYNGLVALAYGIDDQRLKTEVLRVTEYVLERQYEDGWLGPEKEVRRRNFWGRTPFLLGLMQLSQVVEEEMKDMIVSAMHRFVNLMYRMLEDGYQGYVLKEGDEFDEQWGRSRAADMVLFLQWLYEIHPGENPERIYGSMVRLYEKAFDWSYWFSEDVFIKEDLSFLPRDQTWHLFPYTHGVNVGQGFKFGAVMRRLTHNDTLIGISERGVNWSFNYHGTPSGAVIGDEIMAGLSPVRGTELCSVIESMFSLNYLFQAFGDGSFLDRAELAAYNALPVMVTEDWWAHQYVAQTNQPISHRIDDPPFINVGPMGQIFGIEPNGPCCTVNFPQGYPKFLSAAFVRHGDDGIVHALLMPAEVQTTLANGNRVHVRCETNYPFENTLKYTITADRAFEFSIHIPRWATSQVMSVNGQFLNSPRVEKSSGLTTLPLSAGQTIIHLDLHTEIVVEERINSTIAIHYGTLLYALPINTTISSTRPEHYPNSTAPLQAADWTMTPTPDFKWNIAIDPSTLKLMPPSPELTSKQLPNPIWTKDTSPYRIEVMACELKDWKLTATKGGYAPDPPPVGKREYKGKKFKVELQPYGALKVHIAEFPVVGL